MKNLDELNRWLVLIANLGVLAGVILLAIEIRQNQEIMERDQEISLLEAAHLDVSRFTDWRNKIIENRAVAELFVRGMNGAEQDEVDRIRFSLLCNDLFWAAALMYESSVQLERAAYEGATIQWMRQSLDSEPALDGCWNEFREIYILWGYDDFVRHVESR